MEIQVTKVKLPLKMTNMEGRCVLVLPTKQGRCRYECGSGIKGRSLGDGRFRFRRDDDKRWDVVNIQLQIHSPWSEQKVKSFVLVCKVHGELCSRDHEDCERTYALRLTPKWTAIGRIMGDRVEVAIVKTARYATKSRPAKGAGFFVMVMSRAGK